MYSKIFKSKNVLISVWGRKNNFLSSLSSARWIIELIWDRLIGGNDQIYYVCTYEGSISIWVPGTVWVIKACMSFWVKEKQELGVVVWDFREQEGSSPWDGKANF